MSNPGEYVGHTTSERGFKHYEKVLSAYGGHVQVAESSAASHPHVWLWFTVPEDLNDPQGDTMSGAVHLRIEDAVKLRDQLSHLIEHHYQL